MTNEFTAHDQVIIDEEGVHEEECNCFYCVTSR